MKRLIAYITLTALTLAFSVPARSQAVNMSRSGILTSGYSWAYGTWHVVESVPDGGADENDFYISVDKYQIRIKDRTLPDIPLAAIPETNYANNDMDADMFGVGPDEILLEFVGRYGEDTYLFLDRNSKTISHFNAEDRKERGIKVTMQKADPGTVSAAYLEALTSSPVIGKWENTQDPSEIRDFTRENLRYEFIPTSDGGWEHYLWGFIYRYHADTGMLTARNVFDTTGQRLKTYRRVE